MSGGFQVIPFYIVCDVSGSMAGARIKSVNDGLPMVLNEVGGDPVISEKARLSVISFSTDARVELALTRATNVPSCPVLTTGGQTNFSAAIKLLQTEIPKDVASLKAEGCEVQRPFIYFITDGRPGDSWKRLRDKWLDRSMNKLAPNVMCFGVAEADEDVLRRFTTRFVCMANDGASPAEALKEVMRFIPATIVASAGSPTNQMEIPAQGSNFFVIDTLQD